MVVEYNRVFFPNYLKKNCGTSRSAIFNIFRDIVELQPRSVIFNAFDYLDLQQNVFEDADFDNDYDGDSKNSDESENKVISSKRQRVEHKIHIFDAQN